MAALLAVAITACADPPPPKPPPGLPIGPPWHPPPPPPPCKEQAPECAKIAELFDRGVAARNNPTDAAVSSTLAARDGLEACFATPCAPAEHRKAVATTIREVLATWYITDMVSHQTSLTFQRPDWAKKYLAATAELAQATPDKQPDDLRAALQLDKPPHALMLVDSVGAVVLDALRSGSAAPPPRADLAALLSGPPMPDGPAGVDKADPSLPPASAEILSLRAAVTQEAGVLAARVDQENEANLLAPDEKTDPPAKNVPTWDQRFFHTSSLFKELALAWSPKMERTAIRSALGEPFQKYIETQIAKQKKPQNPRRWVAAVEGFPARRYSAPLQRIYEELLFDSLNLRALFLFRKAEDRWADEVLKAGLVLEPRRGASPAEIATWRKDTIEAYVSRVEAAEQELLEAAGASLTREAPALGVSRLVLTSGMLTTADGRPTPVPGRGGRAPRQSPAEQLDRELLEYGSRSLAEVSLCLMNSALLDAPPGHTCGRRARAPDPKKSCSALPISSSFLPAGKTHPSFPEWAGAQERILSALNAYWTANIPLEPSDHGRPVAEITRCEVERLASAGTLVRLSSNLATFSELFSLIGKGHVRPVSEQAGPLVAAAFDRARVETESLCAEAISLACSNQPACDALGASCSERVLRGRAAQEKSRDRQAWFTTKRRDYCTAVSRAESIYANITARPPQVLLSFLDEAANADNLAPLSKSDVHARGARYRSERIACFPR